MTATTTTQRADVTFHVFEYGDGQPFLALVLTRDGQPLPTGGRFFSLDLRPGITKAEAEAVAHLLNQSVTQLAMTERMGDDPAAS